MGPSDEAFLATGEDFPDALGGGGLAGLRNSPLLLTPTDKLSEWPANTLEERAPAVVTVLGGPAALEPAVLDAVRALLSP
ncbi:hypothetical protein BH23ACT6_BH23ACT6_02040 [soil metagenome]